MNVAPNRDASHDDERGCAPTFAPPADGRRRSERACFWKRCRHGDVACSFDSPPQVGMSQDLSKVVRPGPPECDAGRGRQASAMRCLPCIAPRSQQGGAMTPRASPNRTRAVMLALTGAAAVGGPPVAVAQWHRRRHRRRIVGAVEAAGSRYTRPAAPMDVAPFFAGPGGGSARSSRPPAPKGGRAGDGMRAPHACASMCEYSSTHAFSCSGHDEPRRTGVLNRGICSRRVPRHDVQIRGGAHPPHTQGRRH